MKDAFQGWKDAMPKDWTGGKLLDGKLDGWMKTAKTDEINRCKNSMPSWGKTHIYPKGIFKDVFLKSFSNGGYVSFSFVNDDIYCKCIKFGVIVSSLFVYSRYLFMTV